MAAILAVIAWFGLLTGLVEGSGLVFFERINWQRWGPMLHVSPAILWISPLVDLAIFLPGGLLIALAARLSSRDALRAVVFSLTSLAVYDWLALTDRLLRPACVVVSLGAAAAMVRWSAKHENSLLGLLKRSLPGLFAAWLLIFAAIHGGASWRESRAVSALPRSSPGAPNVLFIVIDTLRADHLSSYGYDRPTTPEIDLLASQGALFENAVAPSSWSLPSHVSLVTGRYLSDHGVGNVQPMPWLGWGSSAFRGLHTLGEGLEQAGYRTGAFSANRTYFSSSLGFGRGFLHFEDYFHSPADDFVRTLYGREFARLYLKRSDQSLVKRLLRSLGFASLLDQDAEGSGSFGGAFGVRKRADVVNQELLRWIDGDPGRPFFAFLNYFDAHDPYGGPPSYPKPAWPQRSERDRYDDGVKYVDDYVGRLLRACEQRGLLDHTLVVITSDHGESLGQHGISTHGASLYWELLHVPLVVWYPHKVPAGVRIRQPVSNAFLAATVMDLIGAPGEGRFPGPSLSSLWRLPQPSPAWPNPIAELAQNAYLTRLDRSADPSLPTAMTGAMRSLITPRWQLIRHEKFGDQLYDWVHDPAEVRRLEATPDGRQASSQLTLELKAAGK